ncbi:hypothetical protein N9H93_03305, partial [Rhizobiaceae bacterium]|nr:hypothetical protein [Rhizobiaceae bacterium]
GLNVRSGKLSARLLAFVVGVTLAAIGALALKFCYELTDFPMRMEYRWVGIAATGGLAFFMLRGAWFAFFPAKAVGRLSDPHSNGIHF